MGAAEAGRVGVYAAGAEALQLGLAEGYVLFFAHGFMDAFIVVGV